MLAVVGTWLVGGSGRVEVPRRLAEVGCEDMECSWGRVGWLGWCVAWRRPGNVGVEDT